MNNFTNHPLYRIHTIDSVIGSLWEFYKKNFIVLFLASFVVSLGVQLISVQINFGDITSYTDPMQLLEKYKSLMVPFLEMAAISLVFNVILQYYVMFNPLEEHPNIFKAAYRSLKYLPAYIIILILFTFMAAAALIIGVLVFVVGMIFAAFWLAMVFMFILPILMAEGTNIGNVISRTFSLSHKGFWSNMGWVAILILIIMVVSFIISGLIMIPFSGSFFKILSHPEEAANAMNFTSNPVYIVLSSLLSAIITPVMPIFSAILYFNAVARETAAVPVDQSKEPERVRVEDLYAKPYSDDHPDNPDKKV
ncbi:MAG: hypothetical protein ABSA76_06625 [Bacteroidales bacterium]